MNFKKVLILGLLFSSTWAVISNDNPGGKADGDTDNDDEISSDEDEAGKP